MSRSTAVRPLCNSLAIWILAVLVRPGLSTLDESIDVTDINGLLQMTGSTAHRGVKGRGNGSSVVIDHLVKRVKRVIGSTLDQKKVPRVSSGQLHQMSDRGKATSQTLEGRTFGQTLSSVIHALVHAFGLDLSWTSVMVCFPCVLIGIPLLWAWWQLDDIKHTDEIWTAHDADLREIDISTIGASGVALLRRHSDRQFGILLSFVGIMLQIVFLYFIAVFSIRNALGLNGERVKHKSPLPLIFCSLFINCMTCCASFITGMKAWDTAAPSGYENLHLGLVVLDSFIIPSLSVMVGSIYLCTSKTISGLVFNATSMAFVCRINMQIAGLMSWSLSAHGGRAFQPTRVCIKDTVNTMRYAYCSLIGSGLVATLMIPVAVLDIF